MATRIAELTQSATSGFRRRVMFEVSTKWQDGALSSLVYLAVIVGVLWILSKIKVKEREGKK